MSSNAATISAPVRTPLVLRLIVILAAVILRIEKYFARRADLATLHGMSDRDLKDIGLSRSDLHRITRL